jgi:arylsulfatase A-like enzyme
MVTELNKVHKLDSTLIIITAKHGQSPIDPARVLRIHGDVPLTGKSPTAILGPAFLPDSKINGLGPTEDDVSLLWLKDSSMTAAAVAKLQMDSPVLPPGHNIAGIGEIFWGASLLPLFNAPALDPRTPDILVTSDIGVIYTNHQAKVAEHGGFAHDDTNVIMLLSNPQFKAKTVVSPVETTQVAPTILAALGLDPHALEAVQIEGTQLLPGLPF